MRCQEDLRALFEAYREAFQNGGHARNPRDSKLARRGFEFCMNFQVRIGALPEDEAYQMSKRAWKVFEPWARSIPESSRENGPP